MRFLEEKPRELQKYKTNSSLYPRMMRTQEMRTGKSQ
jgi:hypothetical protein